LTTERRGNGHGRTNSVVSHVRAKDRSSNLAPPPSLCGVTTLTAVHTQQMTGFGTTHELQPWVSPVRPANRWSATDGKVSRKGGVCKTYNTSFANRPLVFDQRRLYGRSVCYADTT
jgi:hypothetical protein